MDENTSTTSQKDEATMETLDEAAKSCSAGMKVAYKSLYSEAEDANGRLIWVEREPPTFEKPAESSDSTEFALIVRLKRCSGDSRKTVSLHSIVIQSPLQRKLIVKVLKGYPGVTIGVERLVFHEPFIPFIHRWADLEKAVETEQDDETKKHGELLYRVLHEELKDQLAAYIYMITKCLVSFDYLQYFFSTGLIVYTRQHRHEAALRIENCSYKMAEGKDIFVMSCHLVDDDGSQFGRHQAAVTIGSFSGMVPITSLESYPIDYHPERNDLEKRLQRRGSRFESLAGFHYKHYKGVGLKTDINGSLVPQSIDERVVIDAEAWDLFHAVDPVSMKPLESDNLGVGESAAPNVGGKGRSSSDEQSGELNEHADEVFKVTRPPNSAIRKATRTPLTGIQRVLCNSTVRGFALSSKVWLNLSVDCVSDIDCSSAAFDALVLPEHQKELILGFTQSQQITSSSESPFFSDVIAGKGKGIIMLLSGPPGVGKTLTAESVAEKMHVPLFQMTPAELGTQPEEIEKSLRVSLELCGRWNAILLLDEAEVFLASRNPSELDRNRLVVTFLRILEYFEGIMFLTTNRVSDFDPAFESRIHVSLEYPNLGAKSRRAVWASFVGPKGFAAQLSRKENEKEGKLQETDATPGMASDGPSAPTAGTTKELPIRKKDVDSSNSSSSNTRPIQPPNKEGTTAEQQNTARILPSTISDADLDELSHIELNGRQIKNTAKAAKLMAFFRGVGLGMEHVLMVLNATQHLQKARRLNEEQRGSVYS